MGIRQPAHLREVTAAGGERPAADARQQRLAAARARWHCGRGDRQLLAAVRRPRQPVAAQVVGASLEERDPRGTPESRGHERQVLREQLVLERARPGGDQHAQTGEQGRNEISEGLARAGPGFHHQGLARGERLCDPLRHVQLLAAHLEVAERALERAARPECVLQVQHRYAPSAPLRPGRIARAAAVRVSRRISS